MFSDVSDENQGIFFFFYVALCLLFYSSCGSGKSSWVKDKKSNRTGGKDDGQDYLIQVSK